MDTPQNLNYILYFGNTESVSHYYPSFEELENELQSYMLQTNAALFLIQNHFASALMLCCIKNYTANFITI